jgi:2-keto-4-pentenoate hydratase
LAARATRKPSTPPPLARQRFSSHWRRQTPAAPGPAPPLDAIQEAAPIGVLPLPGNAITDTVADNASSGLYVLSDTKVSLDGFDPVDVTMALFDGDDQVSSGNGAACLGDPLNALSWLARTARAFGEPLRAGQVVLSGALGAMVTAQPGHTIRAEISDLGSVTVHFAEESS